MLSKTRKSSPSRIAGGILGVSALTLAALGLTASGTQAAERITANIETVTGIALHGQDVFASTVGGVRIQEPAADLATAIAVASAWKSREVPTDVVAIGEIGLAGELRRVRDTPQRIAEAARLGFGAAIVPLEPGARAGSLRKVDGMEVVGVPDVDAALRLLDLGSRDSTPVFRAEDRSPSRPALGLV